MRVSLFWSTSPIQSCYTIFPVFPPLLKLNLSINCSTYQPEKALLMAHQWKLGMKVRKICIYRTTDQTKTTEMPTCADWDQTSFEGDGEEAPGHAYENIGPLNSPPPGFTMPPKPRWGKWRYRTLHIFNCTSHKSINFYTSLWCYPAQGHAWTKASVSSEDPKHNKRNERPWHWCQYLYLIPHEIA